MELSNLISSLGWTIINSLWQGLFILVILAIAMVLINPRHSKIRSTIAYACLLMVFAASIRTFTDLSIESAITFESDVKHSLFDNYNLALFNDLAEKDNKIANTSILTWDGIMHSVSSFGSKHINYIVILWFSGIIFLTSRILGGYYYMQQIKTKNLVNVDSRWLLILKSISEKLELSKPVQLFESTVIKFPTVIGYFKPVILMPLGTLSGMSVDQIEMILAHEIAHIKRADYLLNLIQSFLEILYFFNPAVWIISKIIRIEREYACDDLALSINDDSSILAKALLTVHEHDVDRPIVAVSALGTKNSLLGRIKRMTKKNINLVNYPRKLVLSLALIAALFTITFLACSSSMENLNNQNVMSASAINFPSAASNTEMAALPIEPEEISPLEEIDKIEDLAKIERIKESNGKRKFNFHKDDVHWSGTVKNGKVVNLYKDGERVADNKIKDHEDFILDTLDEIDTELADLEIDMDEFKEDMARLKEDLKDIKIDVDFDHLNEINEHFNSAEFKNKMKGLKESLKDMHFEINDEHWKANFDHFNSDEFKHEMRNLKDELNDFDFNFDFDFDFDSESFKVDMENLKESLKDIKVDISGLDIDLSDFKVELKDLKVEMKKLKNFMNDLREDLVKENYLSSEDEDFEMDFDKDEITVDGKKLPDNLHKRYLETSKKRV